MMFSYLNELKEQAGNPSNAEIAEKSGIQESTVSRMLAGNVENPRFQTVVDIVIALGGSLDDLVGIVRQQPDSVKIDDPIGAVEKVIKVEETTLARPLDDAERQRYKDRIQHISDEAMRREEWLQANAAARESELRQEYMAREAALREEFAEHEKRSHKREVVLFAADCILVLFIMIVLIIDLTNPSMGYFRYAAYMLPEVGSVKQWFRFV